MNPTAPFARRRWPAVLYWITTGLVALNFGFGGVASLLHAPASLEVFARLGYPDYFARLLGAAQVLGVLALLVPVPRTLRQCAYAGLIFDPVAAVCSLLAIGSPLLHLAAPMIALTLVLISNWLWLRRDQASGRNGQP